MTNSIKISTGYFGDIADGFNEMEDNIRRLRNCIYSCENYCNCDRWAERLEKLEDINEEYSVDLDLNDEKDSSTLDRLHDMIDEYEELIENLEDMKKLLEEMDDYRDEMMEIGIKKLGKELSRKKYL